MQKEGGGGGEGFGGNPLDRALSNVFEVKTIKVLENFRCM